MGVDTILTTASIAGWHLVLSVLGWRESGEVREDGQIAGAFGRLQDIPICW